MLSQPVLRPFVPMWLHLELAEMRRLVRTLFVAEVVLLPISHEASEKGIE